MERQRFLQLRRWVRHAAAKHTTLRRCRYSDAVIVQVALWAALHQRSILWATRPDNWPGDLRPRDGLPSQSRMSRRLRTLGVLELIERLEKHSRQRLPRNDVQLVDGRPLVVGGNSKDRDTQKGYAAGQWQRGYKLHLICNRRGVVNAWHVTPMRHNEPKAASLMIDHTPPGGWFLADGMYDCNALYEQAAERGSRWIAMPRNRKAKGLSHRRHHRDRVDAWPYVRTDAGQGLMKRHRIRIEQINAWQGHADIGLGALPHHVRRIRRVRLWVALKIVIYHHWLSEKYNAKKTAHA